MSDTTSLRMARAHLKRAATELQPNTKEQADVVQMVSRLDEIIQQAAPKAISTDEVEGFKAFLNSRVKQ